jgi:hypothetical protein
MKFDYIKFLEYYSNDANLQSENFGPVYYFLSDKNIKKSKSKLLKNYILIDNTKIYVTIHYNKRHPEHFPAILFTVPTEINGILYDVHYHFGISEDEKIKISPKLVENRKVIGPKKYTKKNKTKKLKYNTKLEILDSDSLSDSSIDIAPYDFPSIIYFHKTVQIPTEDSNGYTEHNFCRFNNGISVDNVFNIICLPETGETNIRTMETTFSTNELKQIREIIYKPFFSEGKGRKSRRRKHSIKRRIKGGNFKDVSYLVHGDETLSTTTSSGL